MSTRRMVDAISPRPRCATFEPNELRGKARVVEQLDALRVQQRKQVMIDVRLRPRARLELDPVLTEADYWPFARVSVAPHAADSEAAEERCTLGDCGLGIKRRPDFE